MGLVWPGVVFFFIWVGFFGRVCGFECFRGCGFGGFFPPSKKSLQMGVGSLRSVLCSCYHNVFRGPRGLS